ncbi:MAG: ABC transporter ATP-binding protein, partial [Actinomycetota bacterium]|nr:ABC transporter ATP-binding protein [Actinomycetota bacterium]
GAAFRIAKARRASIIDDLLSLVDLGDKKDSYVESLSRGMKQRLCLARALIHDPKLLILDEPASGLDPRARVEMRELLKELKRMGKTIIVSSHILPELSELCTHIGIIERGTLLVSGEVEKIIRDAHTIKLVKIRVLGDIEPFIDASENFDAIVSVKQLEQGLFSVEIAGGTEMVADFLTYLINKKVRIISYFEEPTNLEDIFFKITEGVVQ